MNVLSCFDGIGCGRLALERAGVPFDLYLSSEIDKYAIAVSQYHWENYTNLGDIKGIKAEDLPRIDLLIGGSPCQSFSLAGNRLNFDDPRGQLFFEFLRLKNELQPTWFLLENVKMAKAHRDAISEAMGIEPILVNSSLVSAQNRERYYWTNIPFDMPEDRGILLKDIILNGVTDREKSRCVASSIGRTTHREYYQKQQGQMVIDEGIITVLGAAQRGRNIVEGKRKDYKGAPTEQRIEVNGTEKSNCLTSVQKDSLILELRENPVVFSNVYGGFKENTPRVHVDKSPTIRTASGGGHIPSTVDLSNLYLSDKAIDYMCRLRKDKPRWEYHKNDLDGKAACLTANMWKGVPYGVIKEYLRKLHVIECERLQTLPDDFTKYGIFNNEIKEVSKTQRYKMVGNGWTVDVIASIFKGLHG